VVTATGARHLARAAPARRTPPSPSLVPAALLGLAIGAWVVLFATLAWRNQSNFDTTGFDIGIHDQAIWLIADGKSSFDTVRGLGYFAENVNLISLVFVPFYWLGAGPHFLIAVHTAAVGAGAIPLWLIGRDRLNSPWVALSLPAAYLLYPTVGYLCWWGYHPDSLAILPLLLAWWFALRRRWVGYAACAVVAMACKEDAALAVLGLGAALVVWPAARHQVRRPAVRRNGRVAAVHRAHRAGRSGMGATRWVGLASVAVGLAWFEICTRIILPANNFGQPPFYSSYFPALGSTPAQVISTALRHPSRVWHLARLPDRTYYYLQMFAPVGFLLVLALPAFLVALPQLGINVVDQGEAGATITSQYSSVVTVGVMLATVEALGVLHRHRAGLARAACLILVVTSIASAVAWGITPIGRQFHVWWPSSNALSPEINQALRLVPATAGVAVSYNITPHVTHRVWAFEFPNPWINVNWLSTRVPEQPDRVQWIVVEGVLLDGQDRALLARLTAPAGPFTVIYDEGGVEAARRRTS
jgi:uncharacterized membrane protein